MDDNNNPANTGDQAPQGTDATNEDSTQKPEPSQPSPTGEKFTEKQRLEYAKQKIEEKLAAIIGDDDDKAPLTKGEFKKLQQQEVRKSSLDLAEGIADQDERQEVIALLQTRIVPSDNAQSDFELARATVNAKKAQMIAEEMARKQNPSQNSSRPGNPGTVHEQFTPTSSESYMMQAFGLTADDILKAREAAKNAR